MKQEKVYCHLIDERNQIIETILLKLEDISIETFKNKVNDCLNSKGLNYQCIDVFLREKATNPLSNKATLTSFFEADDDVFCSFKSTVKPVKIDLDTALKYKSLSKYSFYEASSTIVRVNIPLEGAEKCKQEDLLYSFTPTSFQVKLHNFNSLNYSFAVPQLHNRIIPDKCQLKLEKDNIVVRLRKEKDSDHWPYLFKVKMIGE